MAIDTIDYTKREKPKVISCFLRYQNKFLILKRSKKVAFYPNEWSAIGGFIEDDKNSKEQVKKELFEETGLNDNNILDIKEGENYQSIDKKYNKIWQVYPFLIEVNTPLIKIDWEHYKFQWVTPEDLLNYASESETEILEKTLMKFNIFSLKKKSITFVVPAYNEEKNLKNTVENIQKSVLTGCDDYEIIIINDYSKDKTGAIAEELALKNPSVKVIHNKINMGLGYNYKKGVELATKKYTVMIPGDDETPLITISDIINEIGKADIIIPYPINQEVRKLIRRIISKLFTLIFNFLSGLKLKYYNGSVVHKNSIIKKHLPKTTGFAYQSEILINLLKEGYTYKEVGVKIKPTSKTSAFKPKNIASVLKSIIELFWQFKIKNIIKI